VFRWTRVVYDYSSSAAGSRPSAAPNETGRRSRYLTLAAPGSPKSSKIRRPPCPSQLILTQYL
jgi:hypothetical protein